MAEPLNTLWVLADPKAPYLSALSRLPAGTQVTVGQTAEAFTHAPDPECLLACFGGAKAISALWPRLGHVRWFHSLSAGIEGVLTPELRASPVPMTNGRGVFARSLGEYAITAMLYFAKDLRRMMRQKDAGVWEPFDVEELAGKTLGVVGYGAIGQAAAKRARAFDMRILALRRRPAPDPLVDESIPAAEIDRLMASSDYVLAAAPLTPETRGLIGARQLRAMKDTAVIINLGRGPVIVEDDLVRALQEKWIRGAALDVFDQEPLPHGHPFYNLPNVLLSPHCADHTPTWLDEAMQLFLDNVSRFTQGQPLHNLVDKEAGY